MVTEMVMAKRLRVGDVLYAMDEGTFALTHVVVGDYDVLLVGNTGPDQSQPFTVLRSTKFVRECQDRTINMRPDLVRKDTSCS